MSKNVKQLNLVVDNGEVHMEAIVNSLYDRDQVTQIAFVNNVIGKTVTLQFNQAQLVSLRQLLGAM